MKKCILLIGMFLVCAVSMAQYRISIKGESNRFYMENLATSQKAEPYPQAYVMAKENREGNIEVVTTMGASDGRPFPFSKIGGIPYTEFRDGNNEDATFASVQAVLDWFDDNTGFNSAGGAASSTDVGAIYGETYGMVGDGTTQNSTAFATMTTASDATGKYIQLGAGTFLVNGNNLSRANIRIKGAGKELTKIINTTGRADNLFVVTGSIEFKDLTISGYNWVATSISSLTNVTIDNCHFENNRRGVFNSEELSVSAISHVDNFSLTNSTFNNTPGVYLNGTYNNVNISGNHFKKWMRDLSIWTSDSALTFNYALNIGNAYSLDGSLTTVDTQDKMSNVSIIGNTFSDAALPISNSMDLVAVVVIGNNVTIANNKLKDIYDTNGTSVDVSGIYTKAYNLTVTGNTLINVGSKGISGEGAITVKGYVRDGSGGSDGSQDGKAYNQNISNNTILATLDGFYTGVWFGNSNTEVSFTNNIIDGYDHALNNIPSNAKLSGNTYSNIKKELINVNWLHDIKNVVIENEYILNHKPIAATSLYDLRKNSFKNISFNNINAVVDLEDFTEETFNVFEFISDADSISDISINKVKLNIKNSSLEGSQNLIKLGSALVAEYNVDLNDIKINSDGVEDWKIKDDSNSYYNKVVTENLYINGKKKIGGRAISIFERALTNKNINWVSTSDSRQDAYYARYNEYISAQLAKTNIDYVDDNLSGQTTAGWLANTSYNGQSTYDNAIANIPGDGSNTVWTWSMGQNDPTSTVTEYKNLWRAAIQSVLDVKPNVTLILMTPIYVGDDEVKGGLMRTASIELAEELRVQQVDSYLFMKDKYELGVTYWNTVHQDYYGSIIDINYNLEQIIPGDILKNITLPQIPPYKTNLTTANLAEGVDIIHGYWYAATNESNTSSLKRKLPLIPVEENAILQIKHQGDTKTVTFVNDNNEFLGAGNLLERDLAGFLEITVPIGATYIRINLDGTDVASYDALNDVPIVQYRQDAVSMTQAELNEGMGITQPYENKYREETPISNSTYNDYSLELKNDFIGFITDNLEPLDPVNLIPSGDASSDDDGTDVDNWTVINSATSLETSITDGSTNVLKFTGNGGGLALATIDLPAKPLTTYRITGSIYSSRAFSMRLRVNPLQTEIYTYPLNTNAVEDTWVQGDAEFTTLSGVTTIQLELVTSTANNGAYALLDNLKIVEVVEPVLPQEFSTSDIYVKSKKINSSKIVDLATQKSANIYVNNDAANFSSNNLQKVIEEIGNVKNVTLLSQMTVNSRFYELTADDGANSAGLYYRDSTGTITAK